MVGEDVWVVGRHCADFWICVGLRHLPLRVLASMEAGNILRKRCVMGSSERQQKGIRNFMSDRDYYEILGVMPGADGALVDQAYWHMARKYQTAAVADPRARLQLDDLNEAYGVLGTPRLRAQYDAFRAEVLQHGAGGGTPKQTRRRRTSDSGEASGDDQEVRRRFVLTNRAYGYVGAAAVGAVAVLALLLGAPVVLCVAAVVTAASAALLPTLTAQFPLHITMASASSNMVSEVPAAVRQSSRTAPREATRVEAVSKPERVVAKRSDSASASEIQASTAAMISRWRNSVGLQAPPTSAGELEREPDTTLVEIFQSEQDIDSPDEPLSAVIDILRGSRHASEHR